jgi:hypothetical protein
LSGWRARTLIAAGLLLTACATQEPERHHAMRGHGDHDAARSAGPTLFISLAGQPFRGEPGEPYPVARWFAQVDRKGDGRIDRAEVRADAEAFFRTLDRNHDGALDAFEVADYEQQIAPEILGAYSGGARAGGGSDGVSGGGGHGRGGGGGRRGGGSGSGRSTSSVSDGVLQFQGAVAFSLVPDPEPVASADAALDGKITLAEFLAAVDRRFDLVDVKHLGYLTLADLPKTPAQQRAGAARRGGGDK